MKLTIKQSVFLGVLLGLSILLCPSLLLAASFDCAKAKTPVEKMICADEELSALDDQMDGVYKAAFRRCEDQDKEQLKIAQRQWLKERNACGDTPCIRKSYEARLLLLSGGDASHSQAKTGLASGGSAVPQESKASSSSKTLSKQTSAKTTPRFGHCVDVKNSSRNCGYFQSGKGYTVCERYLSYLNTAQEAPNICTTPLPPGFRHPDWEELDVLQHLDWAYQAESFGHMGTKEDFLQRYPDQAA
jgi:uncharacterized protein